MRVALFFDGKNHMKALSRAADNRWLDHGRLADWIVKRVGGSRLAAAHYYTGVPNPAEDDRGRHALTDLLDELEHRPGFFVHRFNRRANTRECPHCTQVIAYTEEKMVDTSLVADLITYAVRDAFDIAVVFSGDLDLAPGVNAVHALGKQAWVATFGDAGLSKTLTRSAWGSIDLLESIQEYTYSDLGSAPMLELPTAAPANIDQEMVRELRRAEAHFGTGGGFVGAHYFVHRWKGHGIPDAPEFRRQAIQRLMSAGQVETYAVDGKTAIRCTPDLPDEDETVEMQLSEAIKRIRIHRSADPAK